MAEVIITIQDRPDGKVKVEMKPDFSTLMKLDISGNIITPAQGYALAAINRIQEIGRSKNPKIQYKIPRVRKNG